MLEIGAPIPDATVWTAPRQPQSLRDLTAGRATLVVFYLFDWSAT
jgi:ABC-type amino acid transport substrate-binding protein